MRNDRRNSRHDEGEVMDQSGNDRHRRDGRTRRSTRLTVVGAVAAAAVLLTVAGIRVASAETSAGPACADTSVEPTAEEARLERPVPEQDTPVGIEIIRRGGFTATVQEFAEALCDVPDAAAAGAAVDTFGRSLWAAAVARAQGTKPAQPDALPADDDRPLYWTRLAMARHLRQWTPEFQASEADREAWQRRFEYASRGMTTGDFTATAGQRKLFISGFDPFLLNDEIRRGNPSGAAALRLDGRVLTVDGVRVQVQAVMLPVRFRDFDNGIVEDAFGPHVGTGPQAADMLTTISQGRPGQFDLEVFNGRRRSAVVGDNLDLQGGGEVRFPFTFPGVGPGPEFIRSTLPLEAMRTAGEGAEFPVNINTEVVELPAGSRTPVRRADGPTPGSTAAEGGGGGYLSNESAYRVTRLVHEAGLSTPAGHLHTPELLLDQANTTEITDPTLEANRLAIITDVEKVLLAGVAAGS
jgi:pyrrolidone-carboxylate peptidase